MQSSFSSRHRHAVGCPRQQLGRRGNILPLCGVMLGVISVSTDEVESPELVAERIRAGLEYCDAERLMPCTDCGLVPRPRAVAQAKMAALAAGTALVRAAL